jgi:exosortase A-associated hydrolase 1
MDVREIPLTFPCAGQTLLGILHRPSSNATRGVLVLVGGPQYRVGSHRQFVILARYLADGGVPVLRFDYRGMGDSGGHGSPWRSGPDIEAAIDAFQVQCPSIREFVIWGLCDAATASLLYAPGDHRVSGLILLNPWVRTEKGLARARVKHYYLQRIADSNFWLKVLSGKFDFVGAGKEFVRAVSLVLRPGLPASAAVGQMNAAERSSVATSEQEEDPDPEFVLSGFARFSGPILMILSGRDLVAREFEDVTARSKSSAQVLRSPNVKLLRLPDSDHTFSRRDWTDQVSDATREWLTTW